ncbi:PH-like domain-containing protein [[Eubacterium] cellulosolvens]
MPKKRKEFIRSRVYYYGTSVGNNFFRRYKAEDFSERGPGELWLTQKALYFRLFLTMDEFAFKIPVKAIFHISTGHALAGKISLPPILKIHWTKGEEKLVTGFSTPKKMEELRQWQWKFQKVFKAKAKF